MNPLVIEKIRIFRITYSVLPRGLLCIFRMTYSVLHIPCYPEGFYGIFRMATFVAYNNTNSARGRYLPFALTLIL